MAFRRLNQVVAVAIVSWIVVGAISGQPDRGGIVGSLAFCGILATQALTFLFTYRLARLTGESVPLGSAFPTLLGCLGLALAASFCSQKTKWFKDRGVEVGLLGPMEASIQALERRTAETPGP